MAGPAAPLIWAAVREGIRRGGIWIGRQMALRRAARELAEEALERMRDEAVDRFLEEVEEFATEELLEEAQRQGLCEECSMDDVGRMSRPCDALRNGNPAGGGQYRGGAHSAQTGADGNKPTPRRNYESHHIPPMSSYPSPRPGRSAMPAIVMDLSDHYCTPSNNRFLRSCSWMGDNAMGRMARRAFRDAYNPMQRQIMRDQGMMGGFALEAAMIRVQHPDGKYDQALIEAGAYAFCVSRFPRRYDLPRSMQ